ncbi:MAG: battenin CLN3 protein [Candelina mexicana]|nr:MAG: battenin CLN3 protein [Candelina mexicana]
MPDVTRTRSPAMMLPMLGSPGSSWALYRSRLKALFEEADLRVCSAFWLFGLINNVLYVIILSAALDLVGPNIPKGVVLLADDLPSFLTKLLAPYFIHTITYPVRIFIIVSLSICGMLLIAFTPTSTDSSTVSTKMAGIILASFASGGGELSFLSLTHYYGHFSLAAWASGTGGAGLVGAGAYVISTTSLGLSVRTSLLVFSFLPVIMLFDFFVLLPRGPLKAASKHQGVRSESLLSNSSESHLQASDDPQEYSLTMNDNEALLGGSAQSIPKHREDSAFETGWRGFQANLKRSRGLFFPYMLPLLLVYIAEYTINQGVAPTLLFPLASTPFKHYRAFYPTYNAIYQTGVFVSRSSTPFIRVHNLYLPSILQVVNLLLLTVHALFDFIPSVYIIFGVIFWEGLLGGLVYVNTFAEITDRVPKEEREFSLGATSVSNSGGVCIAGFLSMAFEVWLCEWQVTHGRSYCKQS